MNLDFLDANVLIYAYDASSPRKRTVARNLLFESTSRNVVVSPQALAEFSSVLLHKRRPGVNPLEVLKALRSMAHLQVVSSDGPMVERAVEAHQWYGVHFYDGMIIAAAERAGCTRILSEDLNPDQQYFGVRVQNPF
ncbi:MAG: PIN domain-containing protein [Acidobacteriota bacterium]